jgi:multisubunit Na+/H+ antiporter MnhB subunit
LGHICLQPLIALGLAYLAARWSALHQGWRRVLIIGAAIDFCLGIALQFLAQSLTPDRALLLRHELPASGPYYSQAAVMNLACKLYRGLVFFGEAMNLPSGLVVGLLAAIFVLALRGTRSTAGNR